jgi:hypothetical protein
LITFDSAGQPLTKPFANLWTIHVVIVNPIFVARVVGRIDLDTLHPPGVIWQQGFKSKKIIPLNQQVPAVGVVYGQFLIAFQQVIWNLPMAIYNRLFFDPIECRHIKKR